MSLTHAYKELLLVRSRWSRCHMSCTFDNVPCVLYLALATLAVIILPAYLVQNERALAILLLRIVDATVFASYVCPCLTLSRTLTTTQLFLWLVVAGCGDAY